MTGNKKNSKKRITAVSSMLCVAMLAVLFFSVFFIAKEANHDCTGANCPICLEIQACVRTLKGIGSAVGAHLALAAKLFSAALVVVFIWPVYAIVKTLVSLKVKLSD